MMMRVQDIGDDDNNVGDKDMTLINCPDDAALNSGSHNGHDNKQKSGYNRQDNCHGGSGSNNVKKVLNVIFFGLIWIIYYKI